MMKPLRRLVAGLLTFAAFAGMAATESRAGIAYGVTFLDNQLVSIDTTTGAGTLVGPLATPMLPFGLSSVGGKLYTFDSTTSNITQIDPATANTLATININLGPVVGQGGLAFQSSTVGFLTSALDPNTFNPANDLYRFNIATGTSTLIAHTSDTLEALAFGANGKLFGLGKLDGNLYTVDPTSGALTLLGNVGIAIGSPTGSLSFDPSGILYATLDDTLYTLNTSTGAATLANSDPSVNTGFFSISGLAFASTAATVPEPSSIVLSGIFAVIAGGYGLARRARSRPVAGR